MFLIDTPDPFIYTSRSQEKIIESALKKTESSRRQIISSMAPGGIGRTDSAFSVADDCYPPLSMVPFLVKVICRWLTNV